MSIFKFTCGKRPIRNLPPVLNFAPSFMVQPAIAGGTPQTAPVTLTGSYMSAGSPTPTATFQWFNNGVAIPGATAASYAATTAANYTWQVTLNNGIGGPVVATSPAVVVALPSVGAIPQTATFGDMNFPSEGGWRPQLADGRVENIASYVSLQSGSLGAYTPVIVSGKLAFTGANGAPNGVVVRVTGVSGRVYDVTVVQEANRRDLSDWTDVNRNRTVAYHIGKKVVVRQNAQLPAMSRLIAASAFLHASTQASINTGFNSPTLFQGEGPTTFDDEYHLYAWRGVPPAEFTIERMRFADQKTTSAIIIEGSATLQTKNITVRQNVGKIIYDVDGPNEDWTLGFPTTGMHQARFVYVTNGGFVSNVDILDNIFTGGYIQMEVLTSGYSDVSGNQFIDTYGDFRKHNTGTSFTTDRVSFAGANLYIPNLAFSVNETPATVPHTDCYQVTSGGPGTLVTFSEFNVVYNAGPIAIQGYFHLDRRSTELGGHNWNLTGDMLVMNSYHPLTNDWPDNINLDHVMAIPNPYATVPQGGPFLNIKLGTSKVGDGGTLGANVIKNSASNGISIDPGIAGTISLTTPGYIDTGTYTSATFAANLTRWADWATMPLYTSYADATTYFGAVAASPFAAVSPVGHFTPGVTLQSEYTLPAVSALIATPVLSGLTVTNPSTAAFTVNSNLDRTTTLFWNVTAAAWTDPHLIRRGVVGKTGVFAYGLNNRVGATGPCIGTGAAAALPPGNYVLNVACFNGRKKTTVANIAFTAP